MRTIQLSNEKARRLAALLAPQWAVHATQLAAVAAGVNVNTPYRCSGEGMDSPRFRRRVDERKKEVAVLAEVLSELGADIPKIDPSPFVGPYDPPWADKRHKGYKMVLTQKLRTERERLVEVVIGQIE